nr:O-antigen ligase [Rhizobium terrae]
MVAQEVAAPDVDRNVVGALLFLGIFLFFWVTTNPYVDLRGEAILDPSAGNSNRLNQIVTLALAGSMMIFGFLNPLRSIILQPRGLLGLTFGWFLFTSLLSNYPFLGIKALILAIITIVNAAIFLLLPASERQFGKLLAIGTLIMLGFAYFGVMFRPELSIHQASELREPTNAGFWRGHFAHKNSAAAAMVIASFSGFFIMSVWSRVIGLAIVVLSCFFLMHTGGKTASAMLPAVLLIAWFFERYRMLRIPIAVGGVAAFNLIAVGSAVIKPFRELVNSFGIDPTFTNRADIWRFAFSAISERPITGYGINSFWQTKEIVYSGDSIATWATAAYNGHNSYLDIWLQTGLPGLILTLFFVLFLPLRDLSRADPEGSQSNVTRLFMRIWLYVLFNAGLEAIFFDSGSFMWFMFAVALYSFRLRGADLVNAPKATARRAPAHA